MSSLLYQLSYSLLDNYLNNLGKYSADKGVAPLYPGHEPVMLLLHQSAVVYFFISPKGIRTPELIVKILCLNRFND